MSSSSLSSQFYTNITFPRHPQYDPSIGHSASRSTSSVAQKPLPAAPCASSTSPGRSFFAVWWRELASCFLTLAALFALVGTVLPHDGRPLPDWPYLLSINTLVSIYVAVLKFTMAFALAECIGQIKYTWFERPRPLSDLVPYDDASRGSLWGSLKLLWMLRGRSMLASVGAIVTVLSAIIDPFAQQIVSYVPCSQQSPSQNATIPIAHIWASQGLEAGPNSQTLGYEMQGAIINGLLSRGLPLDPLYSCSTGNCTFDDIYYTVGFCNVCEDVTDELSLGHDGVIATTASVPMAKTVIGTTSIETEAVTYTDASGSPTATKTEFDTFTQSATTISGFALATKALGSGMKYRTNSGLAVQAGGFKIGVSESPNGQARGINFELLYGTGTSHSSTPYQNNTNTTWSSRGFGAARCNMQPCVQGYKASVDGGKLTEKMVDSSYNSSWYYNPLADVSVLVRTDCVRDPKQISALEQQAKVSPGGLPKWFAYNPFTQSNSTQSWNDSMMPAECRYSLSNPSMEALDEWMADYFNGTIAVAIPGAKQSNMQQDAFYLGGNVTFESVNDTITNITRSMSNTMRLGGGWYANQTSGKMTFETTCVNAQWPYITFPAVLTFLTLLCFVLTSIVTHVKAGDNLRAHDFKTATLPLMFAASKLHQPPHDAQCSGVQAKIEESVKKRFVRLERSDDGWHFVETQDTT